MKREGREGREEVKKGWDGGGEEGEMEKDRKMEVRRYETGESIRAYTTVNVVQWVRVNNSLYSVHR